MSSKSDPDQDLLKAPNVRWNDLYDSDPWRVMRIQSEFVRGFEAMSNVQGAISVFGSARIEESDPRYDLAVETGETLSNRGFDVITGGGPGIMEAVNKGAQQGEGQSIGVNITLPHEQQSNQYLDLDIQVEYFFVRKLLYVKHSQAYVIFPGGFGTLDELFEAFTLIQTGKIKNFPIVLVDEDFWNPLLDWLEERLLELGTISEADLARFTTVEDAEGIYRSIEEGIG